MMRVMIDPVDNSVYVRGTEPYADIYDVSDLSPEGRKMLLSALTPEGSVVVDRARIERLRYASECYADEYSGILEPGDLDPLP